MELDSLEAELAVRATGVVRKLDEINDLVSRVAQSIAQTGEESDASKQLISVLSVLADGYGVLCHEVASIGEIIKVREKFRAAGALKAPLSAARQIPN